MQLPATLPVHAIRHDELKHTLLVAAEKKYHSTAEWAIGSRQKIKTFAYREDIYYRSHQELLTAKEQTAVQQFEYHSSLNSIKESAQSRTEAGRMYSTPASNKLSEIPGDRQHSRAYTAAYQEIWKESCTGQAEQTIYTS